MGFPGYPGSSFVADDDQFTPPTFGGAVAVKAGSFDFEDTTAKTLFTLPPGAVPLDWWIDVTTDFNAGTNNNIDIGAGADADYFAADLGIGTLGLFRAGESGAVADRLGTLLEEDTPVTVLYKPTGTTVTTGVANFFMSYMVSGDDFTID